jgi:ABC-type Fe3+-siderophore transport system permease subunit
MAKVILFIVLVLLAFNAWRNWRHRKVAPPDRSEPQELGHPVAGVLFAIAVASVLLFALFLLPGLMDRLP